MPAAKYDQDTRERGLRLYHDALGEEGATKTGARAKVGGMLDIKPATLHNWIRKAKAAATVETTATQEEQAAELAKLRKENAQLKEANEILKLASASFAQAELDRTLK